MPLPSVYAGAFKNLLGMNSGVDGKIQIGFNGLFLENEFLLPVPADLSWQEGTESDCGDSTKETWKGLVRWSLHRNLSLIFL